MGKIGMMPFASDWVSDAVSNGMDPDDIGLCLPPAGPSGEQTTAIAGSTYVINAKADQAKKDAAWEYIEFYNSKDYFSSYFENLATKGALSPVIIPRDDMSVTDFYEFPEEYKEVLEAAKTVGRLEFYGKLISVPMLTVLSRKSSPILMQILKKNLQTHRNSVNQKLLKSSMRQIKIIV